jgi:predicted P-loop ATPase
MVGIFGDVIMNPVEDIASLLGVAVEDDSPSPKGADKATWAKLSIDEDSNTPHKTVDNVATILENDPEYQSLCYNAHSNRMLFKGKMIEDNTIQIIRRDIEVRYYLTRPSKEVSDIVQMVATSNSIEPIRDYLNSLSWDGKERLTKLFENVFKAEVTDHTRPLIEAMSRKWWISLVARIMNPGCEVHSCLVLVGGKGIGKSSCMKILAGREWWSDSDLPIGHKNAQELLHSSGVWCWEFSEMSSLQGKSASVTKQFLTQAKDDYRPSYARFPVSRDRRTVFYATTNDFQFLSDGTDRRFWILNITEMMDLDYLHRWRDEIWAEALAAYQVGEDWFLDDEMEKQTLPIYQQAYLVEDPWAYEVIECVEKSTSKITIGDIMKSIELPVAQRHSGNSRRISQILRDAGYFKKVIRGKTYWSKGGE